jgi:hypothetical protein
VLELRAVGANRADLRKLLRVLDEHRSRVGVGEDVLAFLGRVRLVDRDEHAARAQDAEARVRPLGTGVREDRDLLALLDAEVDEPERDLLDRRSELGVGGVDPLVAHLVALRGAVGVFLRRQRQQVGDRLGSRACGDVRARGNCFHRLSLSRLESRLRRFYGEKRRGATTVAPRQTFRSGPEPARVLGLRQLPLLLGCLQAGCEESLVDPTLEDRDAHFHALCYDLATVHTRLSAELGGRQVDRHVLQPPRRIAGVLREYRVRRSAQEESPKTLDLFSNYHKRGVDPDVGHM